MFHRRILLLLSVLLVGPRAWAERPAGVNYAGIDASTLRVFAVGTVGVGTVQGPGFEVEVASPQSGHGTGFAVTSDLIITAHHVVDGARHVVIRLPGEGGFLPARVVYSNKDQDVAVLQVDATLKPIRMHADEHALHVRQTVFAVGYPLDPSRTQAQSAKGIIAGHLDDNSLQLDIALNPGNSGGPLVDESDRVVGMVISRGDVAKGVQGIGVAVPVAKLRTALVEAQKTIGAGHVAPISAHEKMSAEVVDELVRQGTLHAVREHDDLKKSFEQRDIGQQIDQLAERLDDADLLVFVAGSLWNAALALRFGGVREIGDRKLSEQEAQALARDLTTAAVRLTRRGSEIDATVGGRSSFVAIALRGDASGVAAGIGGGYYAPEIGGGYHAAHESRGSARWTIQGYPHLRLNAAADGGWGWGVEVKRQGRPGRMFWSMGVSTGRASLSTTDTLSLTHSFYAVEVGLGIRFAVGSSAHLELYGGIAPSYYSATVESLSGMTTESGLVADHFRATASLAFKRWYLGTGIRVISSTTWLEPIGLGINF